jgi:ribose transport system ATP-binding protein
MRLLEIVKLARARGTSILYVSHRLDEVVSVADRVTVLRGGQVVTTRPVEGLSAQSLAELMVGTEVDVNYRANLKPASDRPIVLRVRDARTQYLNGCEFDLREGEVLGLAGLPGSGRAELPYAVAGLSPTNVSGSVQVAGARWRPFQRSLGREISLIPADRAKEGIISDFTVRENLSLSVLSQVSPYGWLSRSLERQLVREWMANLTIQAASTEAPIKTLSGGNQQKVLIARCLAQNPRVLALCEPTAGVDVRSRQAIYEILADRARQGLSIVISTSDIGDLLALCTRVAVMSGGRVVRELGADEITETALQHAMAEAEAGRWY